MWAGKTVYYAIVSPDAFSRFRRKTILLFFAGVITKRSVAEQRICIVIFIITSLL